VKERPGGESWWEFDPAEKPVPLDGEGWRVADDAELIVNSHREAIGREDTEPTLETLSRLRSQGNPPREISFPKTAVRLGIGLLVAGCVAMFSLGWVQGRATAENLENATGDLSGHSAGVTHVTEGFFSSSFTDGLAVWRGVQGGR
jgi:hypothetical protein